MHSCAGHTTQMPDKCPLACFGLAGAHHQVYPWLSHARFTLPRVGCRHQEHLRLGCRRRVGTCSIQAVAAGNGAPALPAPAISWRQLRDPAKIGGAATSCTVVQVMMASKGFRNESVKGQRGLR
jgi:hypothetical protein